MSTEVSQLNVLDRDAFVEVLGHLFEHSPWVVAEAWARRPFRGVTHLHQELCGCLRGAARERQLAVIQAHPDLAGRLAQQRKLTADSTREQANAGLTQLSDAELSRFQELNDRYRSRFGFPFVICARLNAKDAIVAAMETRVNHTPEQEFQIALGEIEKIALLRLEDRLAKSSIPS